MRFMRYIIVLFLIGLLACKPISKDTSIGLYYTLNYEKDTWENNRTGFLWALSYLGASLPKNSLDSSIIWKDSTHFKFSFTHLGFSEKALKVLDAINDSIKKLPEYQVHQALSLGQYVSILIGSSKHYYAITDAAPNLITLLKKHEEDSCITYPVYHSTISKRLRVLHLYINPLLQNSFFMAQEGRGDIADGTFEAETHEVFDIMPNGQLRFAIYNQKNELIDGSDVKHSDAGKPAKCMWCHELNIQLLYAKNENKLGFISQDEFQLRVKNWMKKLGVYRETLKGDIDFKKTQDHTFMELLYISYNEPSAKHLAQEWKLSERETNLILKKTKTHLHEEFKYLDSIYFRNDIEIKKSMYPKSIRETGGQELEFYKK
jgi:hypothetical protein